ncbi:MAG: BamA/TamA family outer membrane protein [Bacteroidales bacterium]|jgi:outer membrane protein assembly factor BamA|nr:outer membrane protein assembly factor [Bacteroidales bacterium]MCK9498418.1 outer membrane protein assembly factor [Bacteroidales bacterium]MDY0315648.1 BamA/TamA family outer membrane protein [Bacteroidales bacterium]NLB86267.1 BamA/TamA family outer membrane protein [Bacteroidales bacterium]
MKKIIILCVALLVFVNLYSQENNETEVKCDGKSRWSLGLVPVVSYNSDLGFQYGGLVNFYNYGDGSTFPKYKHSIYTEISRYTKGSGIYRLFYDSEFVIPKVRLTADLSYLPDQALDFFGFNGYDAVYNSDYTSENSSEYITRMYYKHQRDILRLKVDFQGSTGLKNLNWAIGYNLMNIKTGQVPIEKLNKGKDAENMLPDTLNLFDNYVNWGIISPEEKNGGWHNSLKLGLVYDTRDNEACPMKGVWSELVVFNSFNENFIFGKLAATHRQYFTIIPKNLSFVYRLAYQANIYGKSPYYMLPYMIYSYMPSSTVDGLGGNKTLRGMIRNRVVGDGVVYGNAEFRYKFVRFKFIKQDWYLALNPFVDAGMVVQKTKIDKTGVPSTIDQSLFFNENAEALHLTYGCGLHIALNENFVVAADIGFPVKKADGKMGVYIGMNWLF